VGRQGGGQYIKCGLKGYKAGSIAHEILHTVGFWHEQSRLDRDHYVRIIWDNIEFGKGHNFEKHFGDGVDLGSYDFESIMHYPKDAFGNGKLTIVPIPPKVTIKYNRDYLTTKDIASVNEFYPLKKQFSYGSHWGSSAYATSIAFGDVDGDGYDEVGITRYKTNKSSSYYVFDDARTGYKLLWDGNKGWGEAYYATSIAFGDVDGDGRDEVGITRYKANKSNTYYVFDDALNNFKVLMKGGDHWGEGNYANRIAFGNVDGDKRDEVGFTRIAPEGSRYYILDDSASNFKLLTSGGKNWGRQVRPTSIAFGDVDGDGRDELGVTLGGYDIKMLKLIMNPQERFFIFEISNRKLKIILHGGKTWGKDNYATSIAFGDVDGDGLDEVGVTRRSPEHDRVYILDDRTNDFAKMMSDGSHWGSNAYATSIAFGDVDGDNLDEIGITRKSGVNSRYWLLDDAGEFFRALASGGAPWGGGNYATDIAFGDTEGDGQQEFGITRKAPENKRFSIHSWAR
jgi:hypothetical protein